MQQGYRDYRQQQGRKYEPEQATEPVVADHTCQAQGCPLLGTISLSSGEGAKFYCRYHAQAGSDDWSAISDQIRRNLSLITQVQHMEARMFHGYWRMHDKAARARENDYSFRIAPKKTKETHEDYVRRLQAMARKAVLSL